IKGPSACRNLGVQHASGKFLLFLDSDDLITPTCLEKRVDFFESHPNLDFAVFTQAIFTENINLGTKKFSKIFTDKEEYLSAFIADQHPWQTSGPLWRKESYVKTGGFREDYTIMEDPELHIRALFANLQFEVINDKPDFFYRQSHKTKEQEEQFWKASITGRIIFYKNLFPILTKPEQKKALSNGIILLYKTFLLSRIYNFQKEHKALLVWIKMNRILRKSDLFLIQGYNLFATNKLLKFIPFIKGVIFRFL
ncbi:MAG: glycosyltransferase, partial [Bacteroidales bacterium]|nr:glycosyltransferase [Bacteroidales bacterium]